LGRAKDVLLEYWTVGLSVEKGGFRRVVRGGKSTSTRNVRWARRHLQQNFDGEKRRNGLEQSAFDVARNVFIFAGAVDRVCGAAFCKA